MKPQISSITDPKTGIFGFVLHLDNELPRIPVVFVNQLNRKQLELLRDQINEVLEW